MAYVLTAQPRPSGVKPEEVLKRYLRSVYSRDYQTAYQWISAEDRKNKSEADYLRENPSFSGVALKLTSTLARMIEFHDLRTEIRGSMATVHFTAKLPDANASKLQRLLLDFDSDRLAHLTKGKIKQIEEKLEAMKQHGTLPTIEGKESMDLKREQGQWRILTHWAGAIRVRFRGEVKENLPWAFRPRQEVVLAKPGETLQAVYRAKNLADKPVTAKAIHIDEPKELAGKYLQIIQCFCFIQQTLEPGEEIELPLIFRINWDVPSDVKEFRVTYEFYPIDKFPAK